MKFVNEDSLKNIVIKGFTDVQNMSELRTFVFQSGMPVCLANPNVVWDSFHLHVAVTKALQNLEDKTMRTKQFGTEILYWLSPSTQISESLKTYGVSETDKDVVIVCYADDLEKIIPVVQGNTIDVGSVIASTNRENKCSLYNLDMNNDIQSNSNLIVSKIMAKEYVN